MPSLSLLLSCLAAAALAATALILIAGFAEGRANARNGNRLMRLRVAVQAAARLAFVPRGSG